MKFYKIVAIACIIAAFAFAFSACNKNKDGGETATTEATTTTATTEEPRFDYFAADASDYISIDEKVYKEMIIELNDVYHIEEEEIDSRIEQLLVANKTKLNDGAKVTGEPVKSGDSVFIFFRGEVDGKEFEGGSNMGDATPYELSIGSGTFIEGFEEGLIGVIPSDTSIENPVVLNLKFPENYGKEELNGKDVTFYVYVVWSVQYTIPEYDADFITDVLKYKTDEKDVVAAHKAYLRQTLEESMESSRETAIESYMWLTLHDKVTVKKLPEGEVEYYYKSYIYELEYLMNYYSYMGYSYDTIDDFAIAYLGLEKGDDWKAEIKKDAENAVVQTLLTHYIADKQSISVTDAEYEAEIQKNIEHYKSQGKTYSREEVIELVGEEMMKEGALYDKVVGFVKGNATVKYNPVDKTESEETTEGATEGATEEGTEGATEGATEETTEGATEEVTEETTEGATEEVTEETTEGTTEE